MSYNRVMLVGVVSALLVYVAFFIAAMLSSITFTDWIRAGFVSVSDADIANVQSIMNTLFYIPILAFSVHVVSVTVVFWYAKRKS